VKFREFALQNTDLQTDLSKAIIDGLYIAAQFHIYHLLTKEHGLHLSIGEFYEELEEVIDELAEAAIGLGINCSGSSKPLEFKYSIDLVKIDLNTYKECIVKNISNTSNSSYTGINDSLVSVLKIIDKLIYKLELK